MSLLNILDVPESVALCPDCNGPLFAGIREYSSVPVIEVECIARYDEVGESCWADEKVGYHTFDTDAWRSAERHASRWYKDQMIAEAKEQA